MLCRQNGFTGARIGRYWGKAPLCGGVLPLVLKEKMTAKKILQACKPGSVPPKPVYTELVEVLSFICDSHCWLPVSAYPGSSGEPPSSDPIHGISAHKVYPLRSSPAAAVGSYPTFSPLPAALLVILSLTKYRLAGQPAVIFCGTVSFPFRKSPAVSRMCRSTLPGLSYPVPSSSSG